MYQPSYSFGIPLHVLCYSLSQYCGEAAIISKSRAELHALRSFFLHSFTHFLLSFIHFSLPRMKCHSELGRELVRLMVFECFRGDSLVESASMVMVRARPSLCARMWYCKGERRRGEKVSERERASQHGSWKMHAGCGVSLLERKPQRRNTDRAFLNVATLAVCTLWHTVSLQVSRAAAHFSSPGLTHSQMFLTCAFFMFLCAVGAHRKCTSSSSTIWSLMQSTHIICNAEIKRDYLVSRGMCLPNVPIGMCNWVVRLDRQRERDRDLPGFITS